MPNFDTQLAIQLVVFLIIIIVVGTVLLVIALSFDFQWLAALILGLFVGGLISLLLGTALAFMTGGISFWFVLALIIIICSLSAFVAIKRRKELFPQLSTDLEKQELFKQKHRFNILLDDSVLADARIIHVLKTGFWDRKLELCTTTMQEVYNMANNTQNKDLQEKGKHALETIAELKNNFPSLLVLTDEKPSSTDLPFAQQLFEIAKRRGVGILTADFATSTTAKEQGIFVLNIMELARATKPIIFKGQRMKVKITQKNPAAGEGIGLLPDGSKVLVRNGDVLIGQETIVIVDNVLETLAGRLIQTHLE